MNTSTTSRTQLWKQVLCTAVLWMIMSSLSFASELSLNGQWQLHQSEQKVQIETIDWKNLDTQFNWFNVKVPGLLSIKTKQGIHGLYRHQFDLSQPLIDNKNSLALSIQAIRFADKVYLNGQLIGQTGTLIDNWQINVNNPKNAPRLYSIQAEDLKDENNELLIFVNLGFANAKQSMLPGGVGITENIGIIDHIEAVKQTYQQKTKIYVIDTIIIMLGVIDLLLIFFLFKRTLNKFKEFKWLVLSSILLFCGSFLLDTPYFLGFNNDLTELILMVSIFILPLSNALFFNSLTSIAPRYFFEVCSSLILVLSIIIILPNVPPNIKNLVWSIWSITALLLFVFAFVCAILNIKRKAKGSIAMFIGLLIYLALIRTEILPSDGWGHRNIIIGSLIFRYALVWAYFLKIKEMSIDYQTLSTKMLETMEYNKQSIARDIHDELGQHLASAKLQYQLSLIKKSDSSSTLVKQELQRAIDSMRRIINGLHPIVLEKYNLKQAIEMECQRLSTIYNIKINSKITNTGFHQDSNTHLYRIIQELIGNAINHGQANNIKIELKFNSQNIALIVTDDGLGFDQNKKSIKQNNANNQNGFGTVSTKERVSLLGGEIKLNTVINKGTTVAITLPLKGDKIA